MLGAHNTYCNDEEKDEAAAQAAQCKWAQYPLLEAPPHHKLDCLPRRCDPQEGSTKVPAQPQGSEEHIHHYAPTQQQPEVVYCLQLVLVVHGGLLWLWQERVCIWLLSALAGWSLLSFPLRQ